METTGGWIKNTVLRAEPCLFGLYTLVVLWWAALPESDRQDVAPTWAGKQTVTFSDAMTLVRRDLWRRWLFETPAFKAIVRQMTPQQKNLILNAVTLAT